MSHGLNRSLARSVPLDARVRKQTVMINSLAMTIEESGNIGFGFSVAGNFPKGNVLFLGAVAGLSFTASGAIAGNWNGDYSVGSTGTTSQTLTGTEIDIIASTSIAAGGLTVPTTRGVTEAASKALFLDNTDGSLGINVSVLVDAVDISANSPMVVSGNLFLSYVMLLTD